MDSNREEYEKKQTEHVEKKIQEFISEVKTPDHEKWEKCAQTDFFTVWRKKEYDETGLHRLKIVGRIPHTVAVVNKVLFDYELRVAWDTVLATIKHVEKLSNGADILYLAARAPFGIAARDFVHIRTTKDLPKGMKLVLDVSTTHPSCPENIEYVRAETIFSGGILESTFVPNMETKSLQEATLYSMITQVDIKGIIPKTLINLVVTNATCDWFVKLTDACGKYAKGELKPGAPQPQ